MITWTVQYYNGKLPLDEINSSQCSWGDLPKEGVIRVILENNNNKHILQGMDYYWLDGFRYGMYIESNVEIAKIEEDKRITSGHQETNYEGLKSIIYEWGTHHLLIGEGIPTNIQPIRGIMVSDEIAKKIGLI